MCWPEDGSTKKDVNGVCKDCGEDTIDGEAFDSSCGYAPVGEDTIDGEAFDSSC